MQKVFFFTCNKRKKKVFSDPVCSSLFSIQNKAIPNKYFPKNYLGQLLFFSWICSSCYLRCAPLLFSDAALLQCVWSRSLYSPGKKLLEAGAGLFKWGCLAFLEKLGEPSLWIQWPQLWHSTTAPWS